MTTRERGSSLRSAASSLRDFDYLRCARLAGISRAEVAACMALSLCVSATDAVMLALLVPLGRLVAGGVSFSKSPPWSVLGLVPSSTGAAFFWLAGMMFVLALTKNVFHHAQHLAIGRVRHRAAEQLANRAFDRCLGFGKAWFDRTSSGQILTVLEARNDAAAVFGRLLGMASLCLLLSAYLAVMLLISWRLSVAALLLFPVVNFGSRAILARTSAAAGKARDASLAIAKQLHDALLAMPLYQAGGEEARARRTFAGETARLREYGMSAWGLQGISARVQEITALAALLLMLAVALRADRSHAEQPALLLVFFFIARISLPVLALIPEGILEIAERLPRCRDLMALFDDEGKFAVTGGSREFNGLAHEIRFEDVTFAYPDGPPVLRSVSCAIPRGRMTALVGPSGAGKSTAVNLLARFYEFQGGRILLDGVDIREYSLGSLRRAFSIVSQDAVLLSASLRDNLLFGVDRPLADGELEQAIADACLSDVVAMLPEGLDSLVGERGSRLSGGQRQRVAVARALLRRPTVLLLDEATSGLDAITEELVREAIGNAIRRSTAVVIAHRFTTIERADHVIVLEGGQVAEQGTFAELCAAGGLFRRMWERQQFGE